MSIVSDGPVQPNFIEVALHQHRLFKCNPMLIYKRYEGNWACDNCKKQHGTTIFPYHCQECQYDLCDSCSKGIMVDYIHNHPLYYINVAQQQSSSENTKCSVCERTIAGMGQTHALCCSLCDFYLCLSCGTEKQHPIHVHALKTVNTAIVYPQSNGMWGCDICGMTSRFYERYSRHCSSTCEFDVCARCMKEYIVPCHNHPLVRADPNVVYAQFSGRWKCDNCEVIFSNAIIDNKPWHCQHCEYDLCHNCMQQVSLELSPEDEDPGRPSNAISIANTAIISPHLARLNYNEEPMEPVPFTTTEKGKMVTNAEDIDDGDECIICSENPKNATLIHGDTGHLCCCWSCAQVLRSRGDPCPICRQKIDHVIRQFKA